jgi:hypothetical protein
MGWYDTSVTWTKGGPNPIYRVVPEPVGGLAAVILAALLRRTTKSSVISDQ